MSSSPRKDSFIQAWCGLFGHKLVRTGQIYAGQYGYRSGRRIAPRSNVLQATCRCGKHAAVYNGPFRLDEFKSDYKDYMKWA